MKKFLEQVAAHIYDAFGDDLKDVCIVLPNRRAGLFLRKFIAARTRKVIWAPAFYSIEDFVISLSGLQQADPVRLLFELYEVHREVEGKEAQSWNEFSKWGSQLLHDFNEIDRYLVNARELFEFLDEAKALALWNPDQTPLTGFEKSYLHFYNSLLTYYNGLRQRLMQKGLAYQGMMFRLVAEAEDGWHDDLKWKRVIFAGFNALTKAEEKIIERLRETGKADLVWDADEYYLDNKRQEAGTFLRHYFDKWKEKEYRWVTKNFAGTEKKISIVGIPGNIGQVKYCGEQLGELPAEGEPDAAVILLDEQLLVPVLNSMPGTIKDFNITMGYPLRYSPQYAFFDSVFTMHLNRVRFRRSQDDGKARFYYKDVIRIFQNPVLKDVSLTLMEGNHFVFLEMVDQIRTGARIFLEKGEIIALNAGLFSPASSFLDILFEPWETTQDAIRCFYSIVGLLRDSILSPQGSPDGKRKLDLEFLYSFSKIFHRLSDIMAEYPVVKDLPAFRSLFSQVVEGETLTFWGEPLKGLQIMGMLESRTLDFDRVILLSCNEDLLPSGKQGNSFIPLDIKLKFGLPSYHHKDAVYAYHFYRLLQRASEITLVYSTEGNDLGGGDKSRFLKQVERELPLYNPETKMEEIIVNTPLSGDDLPPEIIVPKDREILDKLYRKAESGFAPTLLNSFRLCSLQFYFSEIAGLKEQDELEDTIDPKIMGQAVHYALQKLYEPYRLKVVGLEDIKAMIPKAEAALKEGFDEKYHGPDRDYGKNLLMVNVARVMLKRFLSQEIKNLRELQEENSALKIIALERQLMKDIIVELGGKPQKVRLKGFADRIDKIGKTWRVIDYKTGKVESNELKIGQWEELGRGQGMEKAFQLACYALLLTAEYRDALPVETGIISFRKLNDGVLKVELPDPSGGATSSLTGEMLAGFEGIIKELIKEIFDPGRPFEQTTDIESCQNCPYITLCGR